MAKALSPEKCLWMYWLGLVAYFFRNLFLYFFSATFVFFCFIYLFFFCLRLWMVTFFRNSRSEVFRKKGVINWHKCFPVNFAKFLKTPIFIEHLRWLLVSSRCLLLNFRFHSQYHNTAMWKTRNNSSIVTDI